MKHKLLLLLLPCLLCLPWLADAKPNVLIILAHDCTFSGPAALRRAERTSARQARTASLLRQALGCVCKLMHRSSAIPKGCRILAGGNTPGFRRENARTPEGCRKTGLRAGFQHPSGVRSTCVHFRGCYPRLMSVNPPGSSRRETMSLQTSPSALAHWTQGLAHSTP